MSPTPGYASFPIALSGDDGSRSKSHYDRPLYLTDFEADFY